MEELNKNVTHSLRFTTSKIYKDDNGSYKIVVNIRMDDSCKNNMCEFAITADIYERRRDKWTWYMGGCCHDEILQHFPQFEIFVKLHLANHYGQPMYPVANGMYFFKDKPISVAANYLRISEKQAEELKPIALLDDKIYFTSELYGMGIVEQWQKEANSARGYLEELCGQKWENPYTQDQERFRLTPPTNSEINELCEKIKIGYYTPKAIQQRIEEKAKADREKARQKIVDRYNKDIKEAEMSKSVMLAVFDFGIDTNNVIYYNHSNKLTFNWKTYGDKISQDVFIDFCNNVDKSRLPEGITFEIK